jgi:general secretion pathway protein D
VHALASTTRFDVLSRPYILTTDNQLATVKVTQEVPIVTGSRTDQNNNITTTFERKDVGIILSVTPQINSDGRVVLQVDQELSALTDQTQQVAPDVTAPIIKNRSMTTKVTMDKGQTVVVGGLVSDSSSETIRKVPWLGDIPLLGALFRRTVRTKAKTELLVFLTPLVVQTADDLNDMSAQVRNDMRSLNAAVENEALQGHLDRLMAVSVGERLTAKPVRSAPAKTEGAKP